MRHYIYISLVAILIVFCFNNAMGQQPGVSPFGANRPQDTSKTKGQIVATAYANGNTALFATFNSTGHLVLAVPAGGGGADSSVFVTVTRLRDSLLLKVSIADSGVIYSTPQDLADAIAAIPGVDTNGLSTRINYNLSRILAHSDSISAAFGSLSLKASQQGLEDTALAIRNAFPILPADTVFTWQEVLNEGRTGDSVLIDSNLYIGTTQQRKPGRIKVIGDSQDAAIFEGISPIYIWGQRAADLLGYEFDDSLALGSTFFMNESPVYTPFYENSSVIDLVTNRILQPAGGDTTEWNIITRCMNDMFYHYSNDSGYNYTPENFGKNYRIAMDSLVSAGINMDRLILMGSKYVAPNSTLIPHDSVQQWNDTIRVVAADYGARFFDAFSWMEQRGGVSLLGADEFHLNETGHGEVALGVLHTMGYEVTRDGQALAVNGKVDINNLTFRGGDTATKTFFPLLINAYGNAFLSDNHLIRNNSVDSPRQEAAVNVERVKAQTIISTGIDGVSFSIGNNTAIRNSAATNGTTYFQSSGNLTGQFIFETLPATHTFNSSGLTTTANLRGNVVKAVQAFQGAGSSGSTLYIDVNEFFIGAFDFRGTSAKFNTTFDINNTLFIGTNGKISKYGSSTSFPAKTLLGGDGGADMELLTLNAGTGAYVNQTGTAITTGVDTGYTDVRYFKNGGNILGDAFEIGNDSWYQLWKGSGSGQMSILNGAGAGWYFDIVQNANDTGFRMNKENEVLIGTLLGSTVDVGRFKLQVHQNVYIRDTLYLDNPPKAATKDTILGWQSGRVFAIPKPAGGGGGGVSSFAFTDGNGFDGTVTSSTTTPTLSLTTQSGYNFVDNTEKANITTAYNDKINSAAYSAGQLTLTQQDAGTVTATINDATTSVKGIASYNSSDFDVSSGVVSTDYTNGQAASSSTKGFLTSTDWSTFNNKQPALGFTAVPNTTTVNGQPLSSNVTVSTITGNAGTATALQTGRTIDNTTFDGTGNIKLNRVWQGKLAGELDTLTTGVKLTFRMPYASTITGVKAAVNTASSSGNLTIDIHENGTTIMSTDKITIEATETTSLNATTQPAVTDTSIAADALMTIEVDAAGTNAVSGEVTIFYTLQ